jgi:hypothetical protein
LASATGNPFAFRRLKVGHCDQQDGPSPSIITDEWLYGKDQLLNDWQGHFAV